MNTYIKNDGHNRAREPTSIFFDKIECGNRTSRNIFAANTHNKDKGRIAYKAIEETDSATFAFPKVTKETRAGGGGQKLQQWSSTQSDNKLNTKTCAKNH